LNGTTQENFNEQTQTNVIGSDKQEK